MLTEYQKGFLAKIISVPSVGGVPEEGAPYGRKPKEVLDVFLAEAKANGFRTGIVGDRAGWVEYGSGEKPGVYTPAPGGMKRKARKEGVCYEQNNYSIRTD